MNRLFFIVIGMLLSSSIVFAGLSGSKMVCNKDETKYLFNDSAKVGTFIKINNETSKQIDRLEVAEYEDGSFGIVAKLIKTDTSIKIDFESAKIDELILLVDNICATSRLMRIEIPVERTLLTSHSLVGAVYLENNYTATTNNFGEFFQNNSRQID